MPLPVARNTEHGGFYSGDKQRRHTSLLGWYHSLPVSQLPLVSNQCMGLMVAVQILAILVHIVLLGYWGTVTEVVTLEKTGAAGLSRSVASVVVLMRKNLQGEVEIRTQQYNKDASDCSDPLFENRIESLCVRVQINESPVDAVSAHLQQQWGLSMNDILSLSVLGMNRGSITHQYTVRDESDIIKTHRDRWLVMHDPLLVTMSVKGTKPWLGFGFAVLVPFDVSKEMSAQRNDPSEKWWPVEELYREVLGYPMKFAGLHYPVLLRVVEDLISTALQLQRENVLIGAFGMNTAMIGDGKFESHMDQGYLPHTKKNFKVWSTKKGLDLVRQLNASNLMVSEFLQH